MSQRRGHIMRAVESTLRQAFLRNGGSSYHGDKEKPTHDTTAHIERLVSSKDKEREASIRSSSFDECSARQGERRHS